MNSDYLWVRHAPVEEGLKLRYFLLDIQEIMDIGLFMIEHQIEWKDYK